MTLQSSNEPPSRPDGPEGAHVAQKVPALPHHYAQDLTQGGKVAQICLGDKVYTLRITRAEKLILTK